MKQIHTAPTIYTHYFRFSNGSDHTTLPNQDIPSNFGTRRGFRKQDP